MASSAFDLGLDLEGTHVLITGGAGLIGSVVVTAFLSAGANVSNLDLAYPSTSTSTITATTKNLVELHADITSPTSLSSAWSTAVSQFGVVETCIALASLDLSSVAQTESITDFDPAEWLKVLNVNVGGTMLTAQYWLRGIKDHLKSASTTTNDKQKPLKNTGLIMIGSEAGHFGVRTCAAYAASKSAVQYGLLQSLRADAPRVYGRARVNAVAPGPVNTARFPVETGGPGTRMWWAECEATTALRQPVPIEAVARTILFLASERWSSNTHGQILNVDSGKMGALMWAPEETSQRPGT